MASGDSLQLWNPAALCNVAPAANPATFDMRNRHPSLVYAGASAQIGIFHGKMPQQYGGGGVSLLLTVTVSGVAGDLDFDVEMERITGLDIDADSFAAAQSTDGTAVPGTAGIPVEITINLSAGAQMDSVVAGDPFRIRVTRQGGDDANNDNAQLLTVEMLEQ